jgi:hypothetical protein
MLLKFGLLIAEQSVYLVTVLSEEPLQPNHAHLTMDNSRHNLKWVGMLSNYLKPSYIVLIRRVYFRLTDVSPVGKNGCITIRELLELICENRMHHLKVR